MAENSGIRWTHNTFNPWMGCVKVSEGCRHCYAETLIKNRMGKPGLWGPEKTTDRQRTSRGNWNKPVQWNAEAERAGISRRTFSGSLCDVFEDHHQANDARTAFWDLIRKTPFLQWQLLTKRPENITKFLPDDWGRGYPHVWLGTSVEDMRVAHRLDILREIPAVVRFISYEPALGFLHEANLAGIDWIIYGGESGPGYRPDDDAWPAAMRDRCADPARPIAFFYKQKSAPRTEAVQTLSGERIEQYPTPRSVSSPETYLPKPSTLGQVSDMAARRLYDKQIAAMRARMELDVTNHRAVVNA